MDLSVLPPGRFRAIDYDGVPFPWRHFKLAQECAQTSAHCVATIIATAPFGAGQGFRQAAYQSTAQKWQVVPPITNRCQTKCA